MSSSSSSTLAGLPEQLEQEQNILQTVAANRDEPSDKGKLKTVLVAFCLVCAILVVILFVLHRIYAVCKQWREADNNSMLGGDCRHSSIDAAQTQLEAGGVASGRGSVSGAGAGGGRSYFSQQQQRQIRSEAKKQLAAAAAAEEDSSSCPRGTVCLNCSLIAMGEAASYADGSCPQCGCIVK